VRALRALKRGKLTRLTFASNAVREARMEELWQQVWAELRQALAGQPPCAEHGVPCVCTLAQEVVNDIILIEEARVRVRSHRTGNEDDLPVATFRTWWNHLQLHGAANINPNHPNTPFTDRAVLVGAIYARCLPNWVEAVGTNQIRLIVPPHQFPLPEEVPVNGGLFEGAGYRVVVNTYERNQEARRQCIAHYGATCVVCGFNFADTYGPVAEGLIHVHHITPLADIGAEYQVNPITDLVPVCPNCHAVIHWGGVTRTIAEVQALLNQQ
jgi:hypothetical protein